MPNPFVAEIRMFAGNFAPTGWALCNGQLMLISQNTALFSLLGTTYGGDGRTNFALPDLQGMTPMFWGQGPGLTLRDIGDSDGETSVTLLGSQMPSHGHAAFGLAGAGNQSSPAGNTWAELGRATDLYAGGAAAATMSPLATSVAGGNQPHNNLPPYLVVTFIIALQGIFPPRSGPRTLPKL
ncbi:MAG: tail fiber protein [Acidimicrobiales bacterium]